MNPADFLRERIGRSRPLLAEHFAQDFGAFLRAAWPIVHPGRKFHRSWMYDWWAERLMQVKRREVLRGITNCPPRCAKTTVFSICYPCWVWITDPAHRFLCASYEMALSTDHNIQRRNLIQSHWYQSLFGDRFKLSGDRNLATQFSNDREGAMVAASIESRSQGRGGDTIILDDPQSDDIALSDLQRKSSNDWITHTLFQRLNDPATSRIYLVQQRLHESDTTGFVMDLEPGVWTQDKFPLIATEDERWVFPISGRVIERKREECLDPKRFPPKVVKQKKLDRYTFASQFQQEPAPLEGNLVRRADVRYVCGIDPLTGVRDEALPERFDRKIISVDTSFKDIVSADYVAIAVVGVKGRKRYVLNVVNQHLDSTATEEEILRQRQIYAPVSAVLVEDKANGSAIIKRLKRTIPGVIQVNPEGGKVSRVQAMAPEWQAGDWYVLRNAAWTEPLLTQLLMFPSAKNDDQVDALSQCSVYLQARGYENSWWGTASATYKETGVNILVASETSKLSTAETLGQAQAEGPDIVRFKRDPKQFGDLETNRMQNNRVTVHRTKLPDCCPVCSTVAIAKYESYAYCARCKWDTRNPVAGATPEPEPEKPATKKPREGWMDFILARAGL
ncbi:MAG: putative phage-related terminase [Candidatus Sulfotelmatobacter sp.]|nr:putative phage-related terminase [Candidatus Sulfotelmatobacter sp.]